MTKFFIRDCHDQIVGNPKGYRTMRGAQAQESQANSPARRAIWSAYDERATSYDKASTPAEQRRRNLSSIRLNEAI